MSADPTIAMRTGAGVGFGSGMGLRPGGGPVQKRTRVLLSCGPCRASKQKCDRQQPCRQCIKKNRQDGCVYAPRPDKVKPERSMAARLRRLEGMVREMINTGAGQSPGQAGQLGEQLAQIQVQMQERDRLRATAAAERATQNGGNRNLVKQESDAAQNGRGHGDGVGDAHAQVVLGKGDGGTTYVGATHFMAMLDDIEDLKSYFDDEEDDDGSREASFSSPDAAGESPEMLFMSGGVPTSREDLLDVLPPRHVVDRLVQRYFEANSPSNHCVHKPSFEKQYNEFWLDPGGVSLHWLSLLFIIIAGGTMMSSFSAPHELDADGEGPWAERFRRYRTAALSALTAGKLSSPGLLTLQPFLLYVEAEFLSNRTSQMNCYLLISVCVRLMLRMGLHRDPSKLPNISAFDGEMRRRMWYLACQFDLMVSFHLGLPSMVQSIDSDTALPRNFADGDLTEDCLKLPPARPDEQYTPLSYPVWKSTVCKVFGEIAHHANALTAPSYTDVMALDRRLEQTWARVPDFLNIKPEESHMVATPTLINQRFGLTSLYQKSRCVLHRRYIVDPVPKPEHAYSRRVCLESAVALLEYQNVMHLATLPGGVLRASGWFITALAVHDFLLAAMTVYIVLQGEAYPDPGQDPSAWIEEGAKVSLPSKEELRDVLARSSFIWTTISQNEPVFRKVAETVETMVRKVDAKLGARLREPQSDMWQQVLPNSGPVSVKSLSISDDQWYSEPGSVETGVDIQVPLSRGDLIPQSSTNLADCGDSGTGFDNTQWIDLGMDLNEMTWDSFDSAIRGDTRLNHQYTTVEDWIQQGNMLNEIQLMTLGFQGPFG